MVIHKKVLRPSYMCTIRYSILFPCCFESFNSLTVVLYNHKLCNNEWKCLWLCPISPFLRMNEVWRHFIAISYLDIIIILEVSGMLWEVALFILFSCFVCASTLCAVLLYVIVFIEKYCLVQEIIIICASWSFRCSEGRRSNK